MYSHSFLTIKEIILSAKTLSIDAPEVNQNVDIWALITKNEVYFRTSNHAILEKITHSFRKYHS